MENTRVRELTKNEKTTFSDLNYFKNLLNIYPTGILSVVSDTFDLWAVLTKVLPQLKEEIMERPGKLVIRPDSGDPVDILCGTEGINFILGDKGEILRKFKSHTYAPEEKGVVELLWDVFGGTINEQGYKVLDSHIGAIYGDSITTERAEAICARLEAKGFASTNVVFGIGSYTYQYNTRDTFGFAMKATYVEKTYWTGQFSGNAEAVEGFEIFKDPITDDGLKKSAKGLLKVIEKDGKLELVDQIGWDDVRAEDNMLKMVFLDGKLTNEVTLTQVRDNVNKLV